MTNFEKLVAGCKAGVTLSVNGHRQFYSTVEQYLSDNGGPGDPVEVDDEVRARMIKTDTMVEIFMHPDTPVSSLRIFHYDVDAAVEQALARLA